VVPSVTLRLSFSKGFTGSPCTVRKRRYGNTKKNAQSTPPQSFPKFRTAPSTRHASGHEVDLFIDPRGDIAKSLAGGFELVRRFVVSIGAGINQFRPLDPLGAHPIGNY